MATWLIALTVILGLAACLILVRVIYVFGPMRRRSSEPPSAEEKKVASPQRQPSGKIMPPPSKAGGRGSVVPKVVPVTAMAAAGNTRKVVIPSSNEIYKEARMDGNYVARDDNEAGLIRLVHPECNVIIPPKYDDALGTIVNCPLTCPYRIVNFSYSELDQEGLRKQHKPTR